MRQVKCIGLTSQSEFCISSFATAHEPFPFARYLCTRPFFDSFCKKKKRWRISSSVGIFHLRFPVLIPVLPRIWVICQQSKPRNVRLRKPVTLSYGWELLGTFYRWLFWVPKWRINQLSQEWRKKKRRNVGEKIINRLRVAGDAILSYMKFHNLEMIHDLYGFLSFIFFFLVSDLLQFAETTNFDK